MKTFAWHVLILGGFYFIVSLLSSFPQGAGADVASITILSIFFIMFIVFLSSVLPLLKIKKHNIIDVYKKGDIDRVHYFHLVSANISALYLC